MNKLILKRLALALAIILSVSVTADAQLGNLLKKGQKAAESVVKDGAKRTAQNEFNQALVDQARAKELEEGLAARRARRAPDEKKAIAKYGQGSLPAADTKNGDVNFYFIEGQRLGIYHAKTKTFEKFVQDPSSKKWLSKFYTFRDDGAVIYGDGRQVGTLAEFPPLTIRS